MSIQVSHALMEFFQERTGESLRLVAHYDDDTTEFVYLRDDLSETYTETEFAKTFEVHRREKATAVIQEGTMVAGNHHCTLRIFDGALVFNFVQRDRIGTIVSLDPAIGRTLLSFMAECLKELDDHSPQNVTVPEWAANW